MNEPTEDEFRIAELNLLSLKEEYLSATIMELIMAEEEDGPRWIFNFYRNIFEFWCP